MKKKRTKKKANVLPEIREEPGNEDEDFSNLKTA
jgi:hypothetical protein